MEDNSPKILVLVLEDSKTQLMQITCTLEEMDFNVIPFSSSLTALDFLLDNNTILPDIILSDITMPDMDGYEFCKKVKANPGTKNIPFIFLTALANENNEFEGLDIGAVDYLVKPFNSRLTKKRILMHHDLNRHKNYLQEIIEAKTAELELVQSVTIECIANLAENRDSDTGEHIKRTKLYIQVIAEELKKHPDYKDILTDAYLRSLFLSAPLHDIGKVGIPDSILLKPGKLTKEEFEIMKKHTCIGRKTLQIADNMMNKASFLHLAIQITETHHEKWDGR